MMDKKTKDFVKKALPALTDLKAPEGLSLEEQKKMFRTMCLIREFDTQVRTLWMKNEIYGLAHSYVGAEAIAVGACANPARKILLRPRTGGMGTPSQKAGMYAP